MLLTRKQASAGFTLMELMIVIVIIGVIAAIAFPSYQSSVRKSRRAEAKATLLEVMSRQEQFFSENRRYAATFDELDLSASATTSFNTEHGFYTVNLSSNTATNSVTVTASANAGQDKDLVRTYGLSSNGRKYWVDKNNLGTEIVGWE